ncbi:MAG: LEPR-XLL domain-containing protein, partial [Candidatus Methylomirabilales bacterium]
MSIVQLFDAKQAHRAGTGRLRGKRLLPRRRRKLVFERLEPRLLLSASPLSYTAATAANLTLKLVPDVNGSPTVALFDSSVNQGATPVVQQALAGTSGVDIRGSSQTDKLTIDESTGAFGPLPITYTGNGGQDSINVVGDGTTATSYAPNAADSTGGTIVAGGSTLTFTGVTPVTDFNVSSFTFTGSPGNDALTLTSPGAGEVTIGGTVNGGAFETVTLASFAANPSVTIDTQGGNDSVTIGAGSGVSLPLSGGSLTIKGSQSLTVSSSGGANLDTQGGDLNIVTSASDSGLLGNPSAQVTLNGALLSGGNVGISATSSWNPTDNSGIAGVSLIAGGSTAGVTIDGG